LLNTQEPQEKPTASEYLSTQNTRSGRTGRTPTDLSIRFWKQVNKTETCWEWTGSMSRGYGQIQITSPVRQTKKAHRVSWLLETGAEPKLQILHRCDNRKCVRPSHLFEGTQADNIADMYNKGRQSDPKGQQHGRAKLTEAKVREIYSSHLSNAALGSLHGVSRFAISKIKCGVNWRHVTQA
jgi:hypothetical protein